MKKTVIPFFLSFIIMISCQSEVRKNISDEPSEISAIPKKEVIVNKVMADAKAILSKKQVPILCYHNIKDFNAASGEMTQVYSVKPLNFAAQMKALAAAGYHTILPEQLYNYLLYDQKLPAKPIMITFDDTKEEQFTIAASEMKNYGFKGVFFMMTVSINRPGYLSKEHIKSLSSEGHIIAAHTWDHHRVTKYSADDWNTQLIKPKAKLEEISGKPVIDFAYPFGLWNAAAIPKLKQSGYKMAYILSTKRDSIDPIYTIRRIIVSGTWSTERMMKSIESSFN